MRLGLCSRSNDVVEPMIKPQWFVNCNTMGKQALDAAMDVENRKLEFIPRQYAAEWKRFSHVISLSNNNRDRYQDTILLHGFSFPALRGYCGDIFSMSVSHTFYIR